MEIKNITKDVYQTIKTVKEFTEYIAKDGKSFTDKESCLKYENKLKIIEDGSYLFTEIEYNEKLFAYLNIYDSSDEQLVLYRATNDPIKQKQAMDYLNAKNFNEIYEVKDLKEGEVYVISSWTSGGWPDYPEYKWNIRKWDIVLEEIESFHNEMKNYKI